MGKLIIFEYSKPFTDKLRLKKDEYWSYNDTLETKSIELLFKNAYFLNQFKFISSLIIYGNYFIERSKRCNLRISFNNFKLSRIA